jgi:uncharacterized protein (TIGR04551 family)
MVGSPQEVFSEDWWGNARPVIQLHGYFRTRGELYHNFSLGRSSSSILNPPNQSAALQRGTAAGGDQQFLFPLPIDNSYTAVNGSNGKTVAVCGSNGTSNCFDKTETSANLRLRLDPEIHISDNLRILSQLDLLNNIVLGSTPDSYANQPFVQGNNNNTVTPGMGIGTGTGWAYGNASAGYNGYAPTSFFSTTQGSPTAGVNSFQNAVNVNRVWAEYQTPLGEVRFGRMPQHWGLGMLVNSGDTIDSDYQSTIDRIMFATGIKSIDLYFGAGWDFPATGPTNSTPFDVYGGQPTNTCNLCNVNQWMAFVAHRTNPEIQRLELAHGDVVLNGGLYALFRSQYIDVQTGQTPNSIDYSQATNNGLEPRQAWAFTPDVWGQLLWNKLRIEAEFATIQGQIGYLPNVTQSLPNTTGIHQYGLASQAEYRAIDDKLDMQFGFGFASGDSYAVNGPSGTFEGALQPPNNQVQTELNQNGQPSSLSTFRFHPDYRIDLIFYRNILSRVEGSYYFRPSVDYDFLRHADGEKLGGGAAVIWSRASEFFQTPGHARDLGVELDLQLYYQSKDGSLNDDPTKIGGFFAMLQYGVFFPLAGLSYLPDQVGMNVNAGLSAAQTGRLFLGVAF